MSIMNTQTINQAEDKVLASPDDMLPYAEAQEYAKANNIKSMRAWFGFHNVHKGGVSRPTNIPGDPSKYYGRRGQWNGWPDFLGTKTVSAQVLKEQFVDLEACKQWFVDNKIYTVSQFRELVKSGSRPDTIPSAPDKKYGVKFAELLCPKKAPYLEFKAAKELVQGFKFINYLKFREYRREHMGELGCVPCNPDKHYAKTDEWTSWPDFLGYSRLRK